MFNITPDVQFKKTVERVTSKGYMQALKSHFFKEIPETLKHANNPPAMMMSPRSILETQTP